ncbi:MAG: phytoene/squalene synthase family protein [Deltaproteobacteria bacterium]|nr:phytoene/squalene synthase family protein [Deltaproteobacteria bacterium]
MAQTTQLALTSDADLVACRDLLTQGSKSFAAASHLLPEEVRLAATALYAFARDADDVVDLGPGGQSAVAGLRRRLDAIYGGAPGDLASDRALCEVVHRFGIPRAAPQALLEGFAWDAEARRYRDLDDMAAYCARVASTIGVMMCLVMRRRDRHTLARACDLGLALQTTNICRDVGEDARAGRIYLPLDWLAEAGVSADGLLGQPTFSPALGGVVARTLAAADGWYRSADVGISRLPWRCRPAIRAARLIYADIGRLIALNGHNSVDHRAYTGRSRKLWLLIAALPAVAWPRRESNAPTHPAAQFLVDACAAAPASTEVA